MASKTSRSKRTGPLTRRQFLASSALGLGAASLLSGCGSGDGAPPTSGGLTDMRFGMIALTDCSPIVIAHEKGFFKKYGINSTVVKMASWAAIRDGLSTGDIQGTHMLFGMPFAATMGLFDTPKTPMIIPWILNRNGQSITLKWDLRSKVGSDPKALKPLVDQAKAKGELMTFAMTFPPGTHAMWLRYWLAAGGINPDRDTTLITIPPPQMVANMQVGKMDGFCVGEPWNARSVAEKIGFTAINTQDIWKDHPEKVCAFTAAFADKNPKAIKGALQALQEASVWLDNLANREEQSEIVSQPTYINCKKEQIVGRLLGKYDFGDERGNVEDPNYMIFSQRGCNYPQPKYGTWWLSQFRRWGLVTGTPDYKGIVEQVIRPDLYEEAMKEMGVTYAGRNDSPEKLFDGVVFDPAKPEEYATAFVVKNLKD